MHLKIGEFARLAHVSLKTLHHYGAIGSFNRRTSIRLPATATMRWSTAVQPHPGAARFGLHTRSSGNAAGRNGECRRTAWDAAAAPQLTGTGDRVGAGQACSSRHSSEMDREGESNVAN